jgi:hypothetical protein
MGAIQPTTQASPSTTVSRLAFPTPTFSRGASLCLLLLTAFTQYLYEMQWQMPVGAYLTSRVLSPLAQCHALRGRGVDFYAALPGARRVTLAAIEAGREGLHEEDAFCGAEERGNTSVVHCCLVYPQYEGQSGNLIMQYTAARFLAEINSCALSPAPLTSRKSPHDLLGQAGGPTERLLQWPPAGGFSAFSSSTLEHSIDAYAYHRSPASGVVNSHVYPEHASWIFSALSLGWDLAGGTLIGSGVRGLNRALISGNETSMRGLRWARHREACALAGEELLASAWKADGGSGSSVPLELAVATAFESLHPWLPTQIRADLERLLRGGPSAAGLAPGIAALLVDPERTIVVHIRVGDVYMESFFDGHQRGKHGIPTEGTGYMTNALDWLGAPIFFPNQYVDTSVLPPSQHLELLEGNAARVTTVIPPLSYFQTVLRATRPAWDTVVVVGDTQLQQSPLFISLQEEFGALLVSNSPTMDLSVLMLARQLVVSGGSTFSYMAAAQGRARVIHAPHVALMSTRTWTNTCFLTPSAYDARWVFHDVFRAGVRRVARGFAAQAEAARRDGLTAQSTVTREWALGASGGVWKEHVEFRQQPLAFVPPAWDGACPEDAPELGARGLARALGTPEAEEDAKQTSAGQGGGPVPLYFLSYDELTAYYRRPACSSYFFPGFTQDFINNYKRLPESVWNTCSDDAPLAPLNQAVKSSGCRMWGRHPGPCDE